MIFKTREEKERAFSEATLRNGKWNLECKHIDSVAWLSVDSTADIMNIVNKDFFALRKIEPKKPTSHDFIGWLGRHMDWPGDHNANGFSRNRLSVSFGSEWYTEDELKEMQFSKDGKEWITYQEFCERLD